MGFVKDAVGGIFGSGAKAASAAAREQQAFQQDVIKEQRAAREQSRADLEPFRLAGVSVLDQPGTTRTIQVPVTSATTGAQPTPAVDFRDAAALDELAFQSPGQLTPVSRGDLQTLRGGGELSQEQLASILRQPNLRAFHADAQRAFQKQQAAQSAQPQFTTQEVTEPGQYGLQSLINDPNAQRQFIQDNPFFTQLADTATRNLTANKAARGKLGSGGTVEELQNRMMQLGTGLLNQNIQQRQNLLNLGQAAATGQAAASQRAAAGIGGALTEAGQAGAQGILGAQAVKSGAAQNLVEGFGQMFGGGGGGGGGGLLSSIGGLFGG